MSTNWGSSLSMNSGRIGLIASADILLTCCVGITKGWSLSSNTYTVKTFDGRLVCSRTGSFHKRAKGQRILDQKQAEFGQLESAPPALSLRRLVRIPPVDKVTLN